MSDLRTGAGAPPATDDGSVPGATIAACLAEAGRLLSAAGVDGARQDARLLLAHVLGVAKETLIGWPERIVAPDAGARFDALVRRRAAGEPVSRLTGWREFWSLPFRLSAATLDPRPDTETLVDAVLAILPDRQAALRIVDLGTGTGCILLALLSELPNARGFGVDIDAGAIETAGQNADLLDLAGRVLVRVGDWRDGASFVPEGFLPVDILVSNPPYIPSDEIAGLAPEVARFDPVAALDGGADGLDAYRAIVRLAPEVVKIGGVVAFECGLGQSSAIRLLLERCGFRDIRVVSDLAGIDRCIIATV